MKRLAAMLMLVGPFGLATAGAMTGEVRDHCLATGGQVMRDRPAEGLVCCYTDPRRCLEIDLIKRVSRSVDANVYLAPAALAAPASARPASSPSIRRD